MPPYVSQMSDTIGACNADLKMTCQVSVDEDRFEYVVRLFGYTVFVGLAVLLLLLICHLAKNYSDLRKQGGEQSKLASSVAQFKVSVIVRE